MPAETAAHVARREALRRAVAASTTGVPLGLRKRTSNLFRDRAPTRKRRIDLSAFDKVLEVDPAAGWVDAEGLASYDDIVAATLQRGVMPAVVPQLKSITIGGAAAGVGIEATSFRHGLVHDTLVEFDVLLPDGDVVCCAPDNAHSDLFFGFPNSYGTLGYALRLRQRTLPVKRCVEVRHEAFSSAGEFFAVLAQACDGPADFVDGVVFAPDSLVLNVARFVDEVPSLSDYGYEIYYRSLQRRPQDYLSTPGYLWRWDTDWFWCSRNFGAQHPVVRRLFGRRHLNSRTYTRLMRWNARWGVTRRVAALRGRHPETVIQDVDIPLERAEEFLAFFLREIGILPAWICPLRSRAATAAFPLYPVESGALYVNFGFWDTVVDTEPHEPGHFNRKIEHEVARLGGIKSLYSDSFFTRQEFASAYGIAQYEALKAKYDPGRRLLDLYEKTVLRA
ncbi:MAG TPA: FAD-binding oxidoreductase [Burkholderiaceae bacterium]|nr:FAD-binding oxidoreductase [Burkholderiaceae bacterium]